MRYTASYKVPDGSRRLSPSEACLPVRTEKTRLAYEHGCSYCKAKKNEVCIKTVTVGWETTRQIMDRPHSERFKTAQRLEKRRIKAQFGMQHLEYLERTAQLSARRSAAAKARWDLMAPMREFDQQEARRLREWLLAYGDIFDSPDQSA